jgi:hypothetical protein
LAGASRLAGVLALLLNEGERQKVELGLAQVVGPPDARVLDDELGGRLRRELDLLRFAGAEVHLAGKAHALGPALEAAGDVGVGVIHEFGGDGQAGLFVGREIELGHDEGVLDRDVARGPDPDLAEKAHGPVGRGRVPVDPADRGLALLGRDDLDGQDVLFAPLDGRRDVDEEAAVGAVCFRGVGDPLSVRARCWPDS